MSISNPLQFPALVCPRDYLPLADFDAGACLICPKDHKYEIRSGIPRILESQSNYADAFGEQWNQYRTTQLDSYTKTDISRNRLERCLGSELWRRLQQDDNIAILEAGCGAGRFTEILLDMPAASVTSTDLSSAVEPNQINCPQSNRHRIIQCDINHLPFVAEQYDIVLCLGVIQHTKNPEQTIEDLYKQVKPGGWLVIDHYTHSFATYTKVSEWLLRPFLKRLSPSNGVAVTRMLTRLLFPLHRAVRNTRILQIILSRFSPLLTYYHSFPQMSDKLHYEWAELDTHDALTDFYKHLRSLRSIKSTIEDLGAQNIWAQKGGNGIEARCQKPR